MKILILDSESGICVTRYGRKWCAGVHCEQSGITAHKPPYTTRYQAKKLARKLITQK